MSVRSSTLLAQAGSRACERTGAVSAPIYHSATYRHPGLGSSTGFDYSRTENPTRQELERVLAELEGGARAFAFASGMAAIDAVLRLFKPGDRIQVLEDLYGGTWRLLEGIYRAWGVDVCYIDPASLREGRLGDLLDPLSKGLFLETPTNPLLRIVDLREAVERAHALGQLVVVDNTFQGFLTQRPLVFGADISLYSATKFLGGHNDVLAGVAVARTLEVSERLAWIRNTTGAVLGPQDSWLLLRSLKTLALRQQRQEENALAVAQFLSRRLEVVRVCYPGLPSHPGHRLHAQQASGFGAMIACEVRDASLVEQVLSRVKVWMYAESLGGVESLITFPALQTHADVAADVRARLGVNERLLRLSTGVEDVVDLLEDLGQALAGA